ncbi:MAG TPA: 2-phosphosulfolactate phosphatase [Candidatus Hydrogenedentes bacterium]|nr:MAG: putative 2-phosphosulfolactate phosphatase [Candidatus Hydrogenedentes bacterium ADurb.Bin179]HOH29124.1 2-phosphosulfolactate phosphatase [Candidatus Hydrogenedentota bacterium]
MRIHLVEGEAGCRLAVERGAAAIIVDALRASATAAALLEEGAAEICVVREVAEAFAVKQFWPDALLFGERGGLPPAGFDFGNSPAEATHARNRRVIFTTTTGAGRLLAAWDAPAALMASVVNSTAVARYFKMYPAGEAVIIPAGLMNDPAFDAQEDWAAAAWIAAQLFKSGENTPGEGHDHYQQVKERLDAEGVEALFLRAPHADKLRAVGLEADLPLCARADCCRALPIAVAPFHGGLLLKDAMRETVSL